MEVENNKKNFIAEKKNHYYYIIPNTSMKENKNCVA